MFLALALMVGFVSCGKEKHTFEIKDGKFLYDGEKVQLICGEMHYPRIPVEYWRDRMQRAKAMGLNTVSAYVLGFHYGGIESIHVANDSISRLSPLLRIGLPQSPTSLITGLVLLMISPQSESSYLR